MLLSGEESKDEDEGRSFATAASLPHHNQQYHLPPKFTTGNSGPPNLGTIISDPLDKALDRLPLLLDSKVALLELHDILQKPCTRNHL